MAFIEVHLYLDESGHSSSHPCVAVAGFIGTTESWSGFKAKWDAILTAHGVTEFHMTDFEEKRGEFEGWDEGRKRPLLNALLDEIADRRIFVFGAAVAVQWFNDFDWKTGFPGTERPEDPYHLAMQDVICEAIRVCNIGSKVAPGNKLAIIMAEQAEFQGKAAAYYRAIHHFDETGILLHAATFVKPRDYPQLQAADIAAFELRKRITRPNVVRYPWSRLRETGANNIYLRGIDAAKVFPELTYDADTRRTLILRDGNPKSTRNQGKRSRKGK